jgi:hypothetical protein
LVVVTKVSWGVMGIGWWWEMHALKENVGLNGFLWNVEIWFQRRCAWLTAYSIGTELRGSSKVHESRGVYIWAFLYRYVCI